MKKTRNVLITKASGQMLPFSQDKLRTSLMRSGANETLADRILEDITPRLYQGIPTKKIYKWAFALLKSASKEVASRYHLKQGIMELGPSGYPFEKYIAAILQQRGYQTQVGTIVKGKCVNHEIDVIAQKDNHHFMVECKYHNEPGKVCDVKIPLYIHSRFKDVEASWIKLPGHQSKLHQGWVVTNTRFTGDAIQYATCSGLRLMGWDYPHGASLRHHIDQLGLYPVTCLTKLTKAEKQALLDMKIVLCSELHNRPEYLAEIGLTPARIEQVQNESKVLCNKTQFSHS